MMRKLDLLLVTVPGAATVVIGILLIIVSEFVPQPARAALDDLLFTGLFYGVILWIAGAVAAGLIKLIGALIKLTGRLLPNR
jgi:hypothetical protein